MGLIFLVLCIHFQRSMCWRRECFTFFKPFAAPVQDNGVIFRPSKAEDGSPVIYL
jgi:hypothetical protein